MLLIKVSNWVRQEHMAKTSRNILDCFLHLPAQAGAKPRVERRGKALFPAPAQFWWDPIGQATAQQSLTLSVGHVIPERQVRGKCEKGSIQKRRSTFDPVEHAGPIDFDQNLLR